MVVVVACLLDSVPHAPVACGAVAIDESSESSRVSRVESSLRRRLCPSPGSQQVTCLFFASQSQEGAIPWKLRSYMSVETWMRKQHYVGLSVSPPHVAAWTSVLLLGSTAAATGGEVIAKPIRRRQRKVGGIHQVPAMNRAVPRVNEVNAIGKTPRRRGVNANQDHTALVDLRRSTNSKESVLVGRGRGVGVTAKVEVEVEVEVEAAAKVEASINFGVTLKRLVKSWKKPHL